MPAKKKEEKKKETPKPARAKKVEPQAKTQMLEPVAPVAEPQEVAGEAFSFDIPKSDRYFEAVGRRKTAVARVRLYTKGDMAMIVNDRPYEAYFPTMELQRIVDDPLRKMKSEGRFRVSIKVKGGGVHAQAEALRHGLARALVLLDAEARGKFKKAGLLTRDARMRERKKPGLKRARRAPQWRKR